MDRIEIAKKLMKEWFEKLETCKKMKTRIIYRHYADIIRELDAESAKKLICAFLDYNTGESVSKYFDSDDPCRYILLDWVQNVIRNDIKYVEKMKN